jgi:hypothetical protein
MHEHAAREDELIDLEVSQLANETFGAPDRHAFVKWTRLAGKIAIGGHMNDDEIRLPYAVRA